MMEPFEITVTDQQDILDVGPEQLKGTVEHVLHAFDVTSAQVSLAVVDNEQIRPVKRDYFDMDEATDVISFDLSDQADERSDAASGRHLECEILVNAQQAVNVAQQSGQDPLAELNLYVVHGLLHQLGYDDATEQQAELMHRKEDQLLEQLGFGCVFYRKET